MKKEKNALPLDPWIIEEIKRREEEKDRRREERPHVEIPMYPPEPGSEKDENNEVPRGIVKIGNDGEEEDEKESGDFGKVEVVMKRK